MLKEERFSKIIELINKKGSLKTNEVAEALDISLATVRRDLNELDSMNKLVKVFGGASSIKNAQYVTTEDDLAYKSNLNTKEKDLIGKYAGNLVEDNDFVYLDAGTSVEALIPYIKAKNTSYMTNSFSIGRKLSILGKKVFIVPGEFKKGTEALIGASTCEFLQDYNFTLGFFGTNGIHREVGFTTTDINEAMVKTKALSRCNKAYVLADRTKFGKISQVTFSHDPGLRIITNTENGDIVERTYKEDI
jgi:DeoR family fructose operon transcriptional repressor